MPKVGVEPTRGYPHTILSRARLPVPPLRLIEQTSVVPQLEIADLSSTQSHHLEALV